MMDRTSRTYALRSAAAALAAALAASPAAAATVDIAATKDNTIYDESGALSNGAGSWIFAGETNEGAVRRALVAFDIASAVPAGSTITSATLKLFCSRTRAGDETIALHRLLASWGEAGSNADDQEGAGAAAAAGDATWTQRFYTSTAWSVAGAEFAASPSATTLVGKDGASYAWTSTQMKNDVQSWLDQPSANFGWILIGNEDELKVAKRFDSRENVSAATRPVLTVTFNAAVPTGACCAAGGSCTIVASPGSSCSGAWQGIGTTCDPDPCPKPKGACCLPDAAGTCVEEPEIECAAGGGSFHGTASECDDIDCPIVLEPFVDALPVPAVAAAASGTPGGAATYDLAIREVSQKLHRDLPPTRVWGIGDGPSGATYPGPTIEAMSGVPVVVHWINDLRTSGGALRTTHFLPVDPCPHGAHDSSPRTVIHLHGGHVPQAADGYPEATFLPGQQATYVYPNAQTAAPLWYHDHALGITRLNVYMGIAGFYLLRDPVESALALPSGDYEIPIAIQDRTLAADGSLVYPAEWQEHFFGDTPVLNGKVRPYLDVKRGKYRLRLLNGSTSRTYTLSLSTGASLVQIGSDGGLFAAPAIRSAVTIAPGERADVVVDFGSYAAGTEVYLENSAPAPYPNGAMPSDEMARLMKFVVLGATGFTQAVPSVLRPIAKLDESSAVATRDFHLRKGDACSGSAWLINDLRWDDITEYPELGTTEVWRFINRSGVMHPMHMHLVMFQVLDRQSFTTSGDDIVPVGEPSPPSPGEAGWKDTVQVGPGQIVRVIARFEDYKGRYPYHCHILEHEDHEMMRQFQTVSCGDGEPDPGEACDLGAANGAAGSCCTNECALAASTAACRASSGDCDVAEACTGTSPACPADLHVPDGAGCADDGDVCTDDLCAAGQCVHELDETHPGCATTTTTVPQTTTTVPQTTTTVISGARCGDANGDDELLASDALLALKSAVGTFGCATCTCDVDSSGTIVASDALRILQAAVGQQVGLVCVPC